MSRKLKINELTNNANKAREILRPLNGKILESGAIIDIVKNNLNCHERTANRIVRDLLAADQLSRPKVYKIKLFR